MNWLNVRWCWALWLAVIIAGVARGEDLPVLPNGIPPISLDATEAQIKQTASIVRAGVKLTPQSWKGGARVAVCLTFDIDNEFHTALGNALPGALSTGEYGATTGLPRILTILDRQNVPASFYLPVGSAILHPEMVPEIVKSGRHEIGVHGWVHEFLPMLADSKQEERLLEQSIDYLTKVSGKRPLGYRAPNGEFGANTLKILASKGFLYDTTMMAMDQPYDLLSSGEPSGIIELPVSWALDDFPYFGLNGNGSLPDPVAVFRIFRTEFDVAYEERTLVVLGMHPTVSGIRSRAVELEKLIVYMKSKPGVWFATAGEIASYIKNSKSIKN